MQELKPRHILFCSALLPALVACHGGTDSSPTSPSSAPSPLAANLVHVSSLSPYGINCGGAASGSQVYENSEVEPYLAINPNNPSNLIGVWQQDRWSDGGAHGLAAAYSTDGGNTWREQSLSLSICGGGSAN